MPFLLAVTACADDDEPIAEAPTTSTTQPAPEDAALPSCADERHLVVFDIVGFLTVENLEVLAPWASGETDPTPRPGSVELVTAYRERGYEILYLHTMPLGIFGDRPVREFLAGWLQAHDFPIDERAWVLEWTGTVTADGQTWVSVIEALLRLADQGVNADAAYTENPDRSYAFVAGGVPAERNYTLTPQLAPAPAAPTSAPTIPIPGDDLSAHLSIVEQLPPVCVAA